MTKPKHQNTLYSHIKREVRNMLDLEYAIRASELVSPSEMVDLRKLQVSIEAFWIKHGAVEQEIKQEKLTDLAWDMLQVGFPLSRRHSRIFQPELLNLINDGLSSIRQEFAAELELLRLPAANFYRICDLLDGNNIPEVISKVKAGLRDTGKYSKDDRIPLEKFRIAMREPIHLHPSFRTGVREADSTSKFCFEVDLAGEFDLFEWQRQLNEFQYQYAVYRATISSIHNSITHSLTQDFLVREHDGVQSEFDIPGVDSFMPILTGMHCWDLYKKEGQSLTSSLKTTANLYFLSDEAMRRNYRIADERIEDMVKRFKKVM